MEVPTTPEAGEMDEITGVGTNVNVPAFVAIP
jgi:hypothetical protein